MRETLYDYCQRTNMEGLLTEWDAEKNAPLLPSEVTPFSNKKVWWRCPKGHSYAGQIVERTRDRGCPYCAGKKVLPGSNDLATRYPRLAAEWDTERNGGLLPTQVTAGAGNNVWWRCEKGHEWHAKISSRTNGGSGCPYCTNRKVLPGFNDLATTHPLLAAEWDAEKNSPLTPQQVVAGSNRKAWWTCIEGHSYQSRIIDRALKNNGCPFCSRRRIQAGVNDLSTRFPELVKEWDREKNGVHRPEGMACSNRFRAWWRCPQGHSYQASVFSRTYTGSGCPYCTGRKVQAGINDLSTRYPKLTAQWDREKNGAQTPEGMHCTSRFKVWWRCPNGHSYQTSVLNRTHNGSNCPYCAGKKALAGFNDLASQRPELAAQWHSALNDPLTPQQVTLGSGKNVWWQCQDGHIWRATVFNRVKGSGCPICSGRVSKKRQAYYRLLEAEGLDGRTQL